MRVMLVCAVFAALGSASAAAEDGLDRSAIADGVAKVKAKVIACGEKSQTGGTVKAKVQVAPDGKVTSATADGSTDTELNACVAATIKTVTFKKTTSGGTFSYPFVFGTKTAKPAGPPSEPPADSASGGDLDRAAISDGVAKVKTRITACGDKTKTGGTVKVATKVGPDGKVASATAAGSGDAALDACVAGVMKTATFKATKNGGSFSYPFVFGTPAASPPAGPPPPPTTASGDALDRSMISEGILAVKAKIAACGNGTQAGIVKVSITVAPAGTVSATKVVQTPDAALGNCIVSVIAKATFKKTAQGGSFTYPFVFSKNP